MALIRPEIRRAYLPSVQLAVRAAVAAGLALALAQVLALHHPLFAAIAAVIVTDLSPHQSRRLGLIRIGATLLGAGCGVCFALLSAPSALMVAVSVATTMLVCTAAGAKDGARVGGYLAAIIVFDHSGSPWEYAFFRLIETVVGVLVAWLVSFVPKLVKIEADRNSLAAKDK